MTTRTAEAAGKHVSPINFAAVVSERNVVRLDICAVREQSQSRAHAGPATSVHDVAAPATLLGRQAPDCGCHGRTVPIPIALDVKSQIICEYGLLRAN